MNFQYYELMSKKHTVLFLAFILLLASIFVYKLAQPTRKDSRAANKPAKTYQTDPVLERVVAKTMGMSNDPKSAMNQWDWESGIALAGLMKAYEVNKNEAILNYVDSWMKQRIDEMNKALGENNNPITQPRMFSESICTDLNWASRSTWQGTNPANYSWHPNRASPVWALTMLYQYRPSKQYFTVISNHMDMMLNKACSENGTILHTDRQVWDDTLAMEVPFMVQYGKTFHKPEVIDRAVNEYLIHAQYLLDPQTGLWYHGYDFGTKTNRTAGFWGRGNGWVVLSGLELLDVLPINHPQRATIERILQRQFITLIKLQNTNGMWHTVVNRPDFYVETSGTSAITAGLLFASKMSWQNPEFAISALRGYQAAISKVSLDGTVTGVSSGTGLPLTSIDQYNGIPATDIKPYGQGMFLMMMSRK